ncbi:sigma 54-interacting transcriptional regulator [Flavobacterium sp.]|uniref:sigma 54-interacting transcriptional regulator n=1 Tax=Flavobacterium sp. TaxID=239 RepID=UPI0039E2F988
MEKRNKISQPSETSTFRNKAERELLLTLSRHMASVNRKEELLTLLNTQVRKVFPYKHSNIVQLNPGKETFSAFLTDPDSASQTHSSYQKLLVNRFPVDDCLLKKVLQQDMPVVLNLSEAKKSNCLPVYLIPAQESGLVEIVSVRLQVDGEIFGVLSFFSDSVGQFDNFLDTIMGIASQVSVAVANIVAYQIIRKKESEQQTLLDLSQKMAKIRDKSELLSTINSELKKIFYFAFSTVTIINKDRESFRMYLFDPDSPSKQHPDYQSHIQTHYKIKDGVYDRLIKSEEPTITLYDQVINMPTPPGYAKIHFESGVREAISVPLFNEEQVWAVLHFFSEYPGGFIEHLPIIKAIGSQISIAAYNAIANEEISEREREKEMLLSLSYEMARIRDKDKLLAVINTKLRDILYFTHTSVQVIDWKTETFTVFFTDPNSRSRRHPGFDEMVTTPFPIHDGVFDTLIQSAEVTISDVEEINTRPNAPSYAKIHLAVGLKQAASIALFGEHEEIFGVLTFYSDRKNVFTPEYKKIVKSIADQISIAVSNIVAHQDVRQREREKESLLSISNEMSAIRGVKDLKKALPAKLREIFGFEDLLITLYDSERSLTVPFLVDFSKQHSLGEAFFNLNKSDANAIEIIISGAGNPILNLEQYQGKNNFFVRLKSANYKQLIFARLQSGGRTIGFICLLSIDSHNFSENHLSMVRGIADQIAIAITNILANERIVRQLEEINSYKQQLEQENLYLQQEIDTVYNYSEIIGSGPEMQKVYRLVSQVAATNSTVLITGETGTGKELVARAIHDSSPRKGKLMIKVNCAALPPQLIESELFGHERGSFTGATERRIGKFELANKSTLFLDEIGELPLELQVKLLRALQEKEIERVGGQNTIPVDVRIIAATNRDLQKEVLDGKFRSDLFYRLNVFPIALPPLRERKEDIPSLVTFFIKRFSRNGKHPVTGVTQSVLNLMTNYSWPGNVRELEHLIERSVLLADTNLIKSVILPGKRINGDMLLPGNEHFVMKTMQQMERDYLLQVLQYCKGKIQGPGGAAELLDMPGTTLHSRLKKLGIQKKHYSEYS